MPVSTKSRDRVKRDPDTNAYYPLASCRKKGVAAAGPPKMPLLRLSAKKKRYNCEYKSELRVSSTLMHPDLAAAKALATPPPIVGWSNFETFGSTLPVDIGLSVDRSSSLVVLKFTSLDILITSNTLKVYNTQRIIQSIAISIEGGHLKLSIS